MPKVKKGLEGVYAVESGLGFINGKKGILKYCGYAIEDLAENHTFEEVLYLLWHKRMPTSSQLSVLDKELRRHRKLSPSILSIIKNAPKKAHPMDVLRTAVSALGMYDRKLNDHSDNNVLEEGIRLAASFPTIIAAFARFKKGKKIILPNPK